MVHITADDCLPFDNASITADVLQEFIRSQQTQIFRFTHSKSTDEDSKLAEYDYRNHRWIAGRFVGESNFEYQGKTYRITVKPRFGEKMLLRMLEEIFNIRITQSAGQTDKQEDWQHFIKRIVALIWLRKMADANIHGVPRLSVKKTYQGSVVRGRLDVRRSIVAFRSRREIVSTFRVKNIDETIGQIILQAYHILINDFGMGSVNFPDSAQQAINQIHTEIKETTHIYDWQYESIQYKDIYSSWKPVVDLSWDIIKSKRHSLKQNMYKKGLGFFIDMAEVWEQYLRSLLMKRLLPLGWQYKNEQQVAYSDYFWARTLIPDLVFERGDQVMVWDAKYKRMAGSSLDVDRADFFQIHTYIQYQLNHRKVIAGGLLYPISAVPFNKRRSPYLIRDGGVKLNFAIDGIELDEDQNLEQLAIKEREFVDRMLTYMTGDDGHVA